MTQEKLNKAIENITEYVLGVLGLISFCARLFVWTVGPLILLPIFIHYNKPTNPLLFAWFVGSATNLSVSLGALAIRKITNTSETPEPNGNTQEKKKQPSIALQDWHLQNIPVGVRMGIVYTVLLFGFAPFVQDWLAAFAVSTILFFVYIALKIIAKLWRYLDRS